MQNTSIEIHAFGSASGKMPNIAGDKRYV